MSVKQLKSETECLDLAESETLRKSPEGNVDSTSAVSDIANTVDSGCSSTTSSAAASNKKGNDCSNLYSELPAGRARGRPGQILL